MDVAHTTIATFSSTWWLSTSLLIGIMWTSLLFFKNMEESKRRIWEWGYFILIFLIQIGWQVYHVQEGTWDAGNALPLHLCGISKMLGAILILRFNQYAFEFLLLLGIGGALQAVFTPEIHIRYSIFSHTEYYVSHGAIIYSGLYLIFVQGHRLVANSWWRAFFLGLAVLAVIGVFNHFVDGNYIYLCQKPGANNPLLMGDWPYYLLGFLGFGFVNIILFHLLFRWWGKNLDRVR